MYAMWMANLFCDSWNVSLSSVKFTFDLSLSSSTPSRSLTNHRKKYSIINFHWMDSQLSLFNFHPNARESTVEWLNNSFCSLVSTFFCCFAPRCLSRKWFVFIFLFHSRWMMKWRLISPILAISIWTHDRLRSTFVPFFIGDSDKLP